jgi:hypothetical protein
LTRFDGEALRALILITISMRSRKEQPDRRALANPAVDLDLTA